MKKTLIAMFALLVLTVIPSALAMTSEIKGQSVDKVSVLIGETVPIEVSYMPAENYSDVVLYASLYYGHHKESDTDSEKALDAIVGTTYVNDLELEIPADIEVTVPGQYYTLKLELKEKSGKTIDSKEVLVTVQRANDDVEIQKVMTEAYATAGEPTIVKVVAKNIGSDNQEDVYVMVSIPELGLYEEERMGDLAAVDKGEDEDTATEDIKLEIPENAEEGTYTMKVEVYNDNVEVSTTKTISISGVAPAGKFVEIVPTMLSQDVAQGQTATYTLRIANLGANAKTYSLAVEGTDGWATYQINPLVVTLSPESSQLVTVALTVREGTLSGEHTFTVKAISDNAAKSVTLTANVKESAGGFDALLISVIVLAVVLVILIVALVKTRKASEDAEAEESYY